MVGRELSSGVPNSGTRQTPCLSISSQSVPSCISPLTPILSMRRPFSLGSEGSMSGRGGITAGVGVGDGKDVGNESAETVEAIVEASMPEVCGKRR